MRALVFFILIFSGTLAYAQTPQPDWLIQEAEELYAYEQYARATALLEEALNMIESDAAVHFKLAECYRKTFRYEDAEIYYGKVVFDAPDEFPLSYYYLGLMQKFNGKCERSILSFDQFIRRMEEEKEVASFIEQAFIEQSGCRDAMGENESDYYTLRTFPPPVNSIQNDYGTIHLSDDTFLLTSGRITKGKGFDARYGESFTDFYQWVRMDTSWQDGNSGLVRSLNSKFNDGSGSFCMKRNELYFTVCGQTRSECMIYKSNFLGEEGWSSPEPLPETVNRKGYDAKQPAISSTGDSLFFVSDRPGGQGKTDIWLSLRQGQDSWGRPVNLGPSVNTSQSEVSPFVVPLPNLLLFSSNGHQGYGGYDLFVARRLSTGDTSLINMGPPFNSSYDDLYPEMYDKYFFISTNRPGGSGNFDVYSSETGKPLIFLSRLNATRKSAKRSDVQLESRRSESRRDDLFTLILEDKLEYEQLNEKEREVVDQLVSGDIDESVLAGFSTADQNSLLRFVERRRELLADSGRIIREIRIEDRQDVATYLISGKLKSIRGKDLSGIQLYLKNEDDEVIMISGVASDGNFQFSNIEGGRSLTVESDLISAEIQEDLLLDHLEAIPQDVKVTAFENIYFDLDRYTLRQEAKIYLGKIAGILRERPEVQLEIYAYADNSGSDAYNLILSKNRAETVRDYLKDFGVSPNQLMINPQGQEFDEEEAMDGMDRQLSRRVEFRIFNLFLQEQKNNGVCFTRNKIELDQLLRNINWSEDQLVELNGPLPDEFRAFEPIRVPATTASNKDIQCLAPH